MRKQALAADVRTSEELAVAANGIHPARIVVHGDTMSDPELLCAANVGVGRVIIDSFAEADYRALCNEKRIQAVLLGMKDPGLCGGGCIDDAMVAVLAHRRLFLSGLHARIGLRATEFVSCTAAIGDMVAEMGRVRERHGKVLTLLGLHLDVRATESVAALRTLADRIAATLDDACATARFPKPRVLLSLNSPSAPQ